MDNLAYQDELRMEIEQFNDMMNDFDAWSNID